MMKHFIYNIALMRVIDDEITLHISSQCASPTKELRRERERERERDREK